jgi:DNA-binding PadR family transcriptional regulator
MGNLYRFVEPVVLHLLIREGPCHGYELATSLRREALTDASVEHAALYRTLKQLEQYGYVQSQWDAAGSGPARHVYAITEAGVQHVRDWTVVLDRLARSMQSFVKEARICASAGVRGPVEETRS